MPKPSSESLHVPSIDELRRSVVARSTSLVKAKPKGKAPETRSVKKPDTVESKTALLSPLAEALLRDAALPGRTTVSLEERWAVLAVTSGSIKKRVLDELHRGGFIRLEKKGKINVIHLFAKAWEYLGWKSPKGEGTGGTTHRALVKSLATMFSEKKYEVKIEQELGAHGKRADLVCYGPERILAIEVGLTDLDQECKNLRDDLQSGVPDHVLFVSCDEELLAKVKRLANEDPYLRENWKRITFFFFDKISPIDDSPTR